MLNAVSLSRMVDTLRALEDQSQNFKMARVHIMVREEFLEGLGCKQRKQTNK